MLENKHTGVSGWIKINLPDPSQFNATDIDFVLFNLINRKLRLVEFKTGNSKLTARQRMVFSMIDLALSIGFKVNRWMNIEYLGFVTVWLSGTSPADSAQIRWGGISGEIITEKELIKRLSMED